MIEVIGWLGAFLLANCGIPQLLKTMQSTASVKGLSMWFLFMWFFGELLTMVYIVDKAFRWPLIFNYSFNILIITVILTVFFFYRKGKDRNLLKELYHKYYGVINNPVILENICYASVVIFLYNT